MTQLMQNPGVLSSLFFALCASSHAAVLLSVDMEGNQSGSGNPSYATQTGFQTFNPGTVTTSGGNIFQTYSGISGVNVDGNVTVTLATSTGNARNRPALAAGATVAYPDLLHDQFVGMQSSGQTVATAAATTRLSLDGLLADTQYYIRIYSYGQGTDQGFFYTWYDKTDGTADSIGTIENKQIVSGDVVGPDAYSVYALVTTDATGALRFGFSGASTSTGTTTGGTGGINGIILYSVPEPSHVTLSALGFTGLLLKRRRKA